jgi:hypothetical protein
MLVTVKHSQATDHGGGGPTLKDALTQPMEAALNQTMFLTLFSKAIGKHTTRQNAVVQSIIGKARQMAPK